MCKYTAISFAPVQGFIEKSRKLRDLYGASQILSYLSVCLIRKISKLYKECQLIQPNIKLDSEELEIEHLPLLTGNVWRGVPNRIVFKGNIDKAVAKNFLCQIWFEVLDTCRREIEANIHFSEGYHWNQEWIRWRDYTWEFFWGQGEDPQKANDDLETRKLKRDWTAINWTGESSSITGTDAIAWHRLGDPRIKPNRRLSEEEERQQAEFYLQLAKFSENLHTLPGNSQLPEGKFISLDERLSIPELAKRLVNLEQIADQLKMPRLPESLTNLQRKPEEINERLIPGQWTGWFMGDGDKMGDYLKQIYLQLGDDGLKDVSKKLLQWGKDFQGRFPTSYLVPKGNHFGRVIYAGGDDFLGLIYSPNPQPPIPTHSVYKWLQTFPEEWNKHELPAIKDYPKTGEFQSPTVSVGFVWAAPSVPQRDVLQHCREAEKRSKSLGRDRVTIRVVFNSGQYVQWTCPWTHLKILDSYQDRNRGKNWSHLYNDWAHLQSRHAIRFIETEKCKIKREDRDLAIQILDLYFDGAGSKISKDPDIKKRWDYVAGDNKHLNIISWIDDLVKVGWQLWSNSSI